jgi:asparagine synthase (glutamine-hydrolysing)
MRDAGATDVQTITLGFREFHGRADDEVGLAAQVARHYEMPHSTRTVSEAEFREDLPKILHAMDQPSIDGINTWFVSKAARELGLKVAVSGLGGDELFGGYPSFRDLPAWTRWFAYSRPFGIPVRALLSRVGPTWLGLNPKAAGMLEYGGSWTGAYLLRRGIFMPWELPALMNRDVLRQGLERLGPGFGSERAFEGETATPFGKVATLETTLYMRNQLLRDTDWASMAHSLEVRVPLVDSTLLAAIAPAMAGMGVGLGKAQLARAPRKPLPEAVTNRPKTGFATPIGDWVTATMSGNGAADAAASPKAPWARRWALHVAQRVAPSLTLPSLNH